MHPPNVRLTLLAALFVVTITSLSAQQYQWKNFAGTPGVTTKVDGPLATATFVNIAGVCRDAHGHLYVTDTNTIRKITADGIVVTLAGGPRSGSTDGAGVAAQFNGATGIAVNASGTLYVSDTINHTIRKITPQGFVTTIAGSAGLFGSADGTGSAARFFYPRNLSIDAAGNVFITDAGNHTIRKLTPGGQVETYAGKASSPSYANGPRLEARFHNPLGIAVDSFGTVFVSDLRGVIRKITSAGIVQLLAGDPALAGTDDGIGDSARFRSPDHLATDGFGNCFVSDIRSHTVRKVTSEGVVTTIGGAADVPGSSEGAASQAMFEKPGAITTGPNGLLWVADFNNRLSQGRADAPQLIRNPTGTVSLYFRMPADSTWDLQRSTAPGLKNWRALGTFTAGRDGGISFIDTAPPPGAAFYRLKSNPGIGDPLP